MLVPQCTAAVMYFFAWRAGNCMLHGCIAYYTTKPWSAARWWFDGRLFVWRGITGPIDHTPPADCVIAWELSMCPTVERMGTNFGDLRHGVGEWSEGHWKTKIRNGN